MHTTSFFLSLAWTIALAVSVLSANGQDLAPSDSIDIIAATIASATAPVAVEPAAVAGDLQVYQDAIVAPWQSNSWNATIDYASTERIYAGTNAVRVAQNAWGGFSLHIGMWGAAVNVDPSAYPRFEFAIHGGSAGITLAVQLENDLAASFPLVHYGTIPANQWVLVALTMGQLNPNNQPVDRISILERSGAARTYYVDNIRFVGTSAITVPGAPATAAPSNGATGVGVSPTLQWTAPSGAASHRVQISTGSTFASTLADRAGLATPALALSALLNSTVYYWRANASNSAGTSAWSATASFTTAALPLTPPAPILSAPANAAAGVSQNPTLQWNASTGAASYQLQVSPSAAFTSLASDQASLTSLSYSLAGLTSGTTYYWRVNAGNSGGSGAWSTVWSFTTGTAPAPTADLVVYQEAIQSPWQDNSWSAAITYASTERAYGGSNAVKVVQNAWGALSMHIGSWGAAVNVDPQRYARFEFAAYGGASGLSLYVRLENDLSATFPLTNYGTIPANQWVVVSLPMSQLNPDNQPIDRLSILEMSGAARTYFVDEIRFKGSSQTVMAPLAPALASPSNGATGVGIPPTLQWNASPGAASYRVQISTASSFATTIADQTGLTGLSMTMSVALSNAPYYWRVNASNSSGTSPWSATAGFTTAAALAAPGVPVLSLPASGATGVSTTTSLSWGAASGASSYRVQLSTGSTFATTVVDQTGVTALSHALTGVSAGTQYYWRVSAANSVGSSGFSAARGFTTAATVTPPPTGKLFVTGYYPDFGVCSLPPSQVDYSAMTHIIYFHTDVDVNVSPYFLPVVSAAESTRIEWSNANQGCARSNGESYQAELIRLSHAAGVKVLLCVGGIYGAGADRMAVIAADSVKTQIWANSLTAYLVRKGFDGVDLDWEFPRAQADYMRMLRIVRRKFDAMPARGIFVAAVYGDANSSAYDYPNLKYYLDQVNIMTYDMWNNQNTVWLNSPLGKAAGSPSAWRTWRASSALSWAAKGVPKSILANGIPFYTWKFSNATALGQPLSGYSYATYTDALNALSAGGTYHWDDSAKAPYVTYTSGGVNYLITYDDTNSVKAKVQRTKDDGIGGIMIYELWSGWLPSQPAGKRDPLLQAVKRAVASLGGLPSMAQPARGDAAVAEPSADPAVPATFGLAQNFPNPFNPITTINFQVPVAATVTIKIYSMIGQEVATLVEGKLEAGTHSILWDSRNSDGESMASGVYLYRMVAVPVDGSTAQAYTSLRKLTLLK